jgi:hypothetical protein
MSQITNFVALRNNPALVEFRNYILSFYGYDGLYPEEGFNVAACEIAIQDYLKICSKKYAKWEWGDGDSIDRERVLTCFEMKKSEKKG